MSEAKQATIKYKYKKFIDYTLDRIKKVDEYYKQLLELKFKKKQKSKLLKVKSKIYIEI